MENRKFSYTADGRRRSITKDGKSRLQRECTGCRSAVWAAATLLFCVCVLGVLIWREGWEKETAEARKTVKEEPPSVNKEIIIEPEPEPEIEEKPDIELELPSEPEPEELPHDHLSTELLRPEGRVILRQAGMLNGKPENLSAVFQPEQFGRFQADRNEQVMTVDVGEEEAAFPQTLAAGESIVWHLDKVDTGEDLLARVAAVSTGTRRQFDGTAALQIMFNDELAYNRYLVQNEKVNIRALLPAAWVEERGNTLVLTNTGRQPFMFDAVWIEEAAPARRSITLGVNGNEFIPKTLRGRVPVYPESDVSLSRAANWSSLPDGATVNFFRKLSSPRAFRQEHGRNWHIRSNTVLDGRRSRSILSAYAGITGFFHKGGTHLRLSRVSGPGCLVSRVSGEINPEGYALLAAAELAPRPGTASLDINVTRFGGSEKPLYPVYWTAGLHDDETATIMIVRHPLLKSPPSVTVTASLPWSGETRMSGRHGACPEGVLKELGSGQDSDLASTSFSEVIELAENRDGGLFQHTFNFNQVLLIRLKQPGASFPEPEPIPEDAGEEIDYSQWRSPPLALGRPIVSETPEGRFIRRYRAAPVSDSSVDHRVLSRAYSVSLEPATPGRVGKALHVVPIREKSLFYRVDGEAGPAVLAEGVQFHINRRRPYLDPAFGRAFDFWVYPHSTGGEEELTLKIQFGPHRPQTVTAKLRPRRWQRVTVPIPEQEKKRWTPPRWGMIFVPHSEEGGRRDIEFEINAFSVIESAAGNIEHHRIRRLSEERRLVLLYGRPGRNAAFRHRFPHRVEVHEIEVHGNSPDQDPRVEWNKKAQMLEVDRVRFGDETSEAAAVHLSDRELDRLEEEGLSVIAVIFEVYE